MPTRQAIIELLLLDTCSQQEEWKGIVLYLPLQTKFLKIVNLIKSKNEVGVDLCVYPVQYYRLGSVP
jgi:hypothetical protein